MPEKSSNLNRIVVWNCDVVLPANGRGYANVAAGLARGLVAYPPQHFYQVAA
jgi:hypothetical protein